MVVAPTVPANTPELVRVDSGLLRGARADQLLVWKGIPYAAPPIGALRWKPPLAMTPWPGVRDATGFGYQCVQAGSSIDPRGSASGSEDCLTLNVWRPASTGKVRPIMVFVHGGYFTWGASSYRMGGTDLYDGAQLAAAADVVVVTLNYRLGPFGFLAHPGLSDEDPHHASGNYGLLDQLAALAWVQRNAAAFGGDPTRVTLFGQSAGAISSAALYASPLAKGLFHRVILHSGSGDALRMDRAQRTGRELQRLTHCDRATLAETTVCLREKSPLAIATAVPESFGSDGVKYGPVIDGWVLPAQPLALVERGAHNHVPLVVATTSNEFSTMVHSYLEAPLVTDADYQALLGHRFGAAFARVLLARYPASTYGSPLAAFTALMSDVAFTCQSDWLAGAAAATQTEPVYRFVYAHTFAGTLARFGAGHGMDLYLVFRNTPPYLVLDPAERVLSDQLIASWSRLAHTGELDWIRHTRDGHGETTLDAKLEASTDEPARERCAFWRPLIHDRH